MSTTRATRHYVDNLDAKTLRDDAGAHRLELLDRMGTDCAALAIDAAETASASSSLEIMLAHQLAVAHKAALEVVDKAAFEENVHEKAKLMGAAARMMETFQKGLLTLQRMRTGGSQHITVHHISVEGGSQAILGQVTAGARQE